MVRDPAVVVDITGLALHLGSSSSFSCSSEPMHGESGVVLDTMKDTVDMIATNTVMDHDEGLYSRGEAMIAMI
jgi:hypothetical protein